MVGSTPFLLENLKVEYGKKSLGVGNDVKCDLIFAQKYEFSIKILRSLQCISVMCVTD